MPGFKLTFDNRFTIIGHPLILGLRIPFRHFGYLVNSQAPP